MQEIATEVKGTEERCSDIETLAQKEERKKKALPVIHGLQIPLRIQSDLIKAAFCLPHLLQPEWILLSLPLLSPLHPPFPQAPTIWVCFGKFGPCFTSTAAPTNLWPPGSADKTMQSKYNCMKSLAVLYSSFYRNALHNLSPKVITLISRSLNRAHLFYNAKKYHLPIKGTIRSL